MTLKPEKGIFMPASTVHTDREYNEQSERIHKHPHEAKVILFPLSEPTSIWWAKSSH